MEDHEIPKSPNDGGNRLSQPQEETKGIAGKNDVKPSGKANKTSRVVCDRCHRPKPQACICEALPDKLIRLKTTEVIVLQHPLEVKQHKATANRSVPLLELCLAPESLHLVTERRLGDDIDGTVLDKLHRQFDLYQPVLVFPRLRVDSENAKMEILSLNELIAKIKKEREHKSDAKSTKNEGNSVTTATSALASKPAAPLQNKKILLLVLDATWKYAREMHMANQKYRQYPPHMIQLALEKEDLPMGDGYKPRRFEIRGKVSATGGKRAAHEEDTTTTWMCTAECMSLIVSRLEEELGVTSDASAASAAGDTQPPSSLHATLMKPLDAMVAKWKAFLSTPKNRKHDLERGMSKKEKRKKRQQQHQEQQQG